MNFACLDNNFHTDAREFSQELNFASRDFGVASFTAGLYYYNGKGGTTNVLQETVVPGGVTISDSTFSTRSYAAFSEVTLKPVKNLSVIGGLRHTYERKNDSPLPTLPDILRKFHAWTPRITVKYDLSSELNVYATYSQGYKSGLTGATNAINGFLPVKPERLTSYEIGTKFAARNATISLSGFYYDYKDKQEQIFLGRGVAVINTGPVRIYGLDADATYKASPHLTFNANLSYIPVAKYRDFPNATGTSTVQIPFVPVSAATPFGCTPGGGCGGFFPGSGQQVAASFDASGSRLTRAPKVSANGTVSFNHEIAGGTFDTSLTLSYISQAYHDLTQTVVQPGYALLNAQIGYQFADTPLKVSIYGRNITNEKYIIASTSSAAGFYANYGPPQEIGASLQYSF